MSGDVQPRKRKDKKRKKDDSVEQIPTQPQTPSPSIQSEDITIHVHKEDGTGGGICAKIVFFLLFSALAIVIGLIITEHRGLTDLDTADQESRFSHLFEGWTDNSLSHDEHDIEDDIVNSLEEDDHGEEEETESHEHEEEEEEEPHEEEEEEASDEVTQSEEEEEEEDEEEASEEVPQTEEEEEDEEEPNASEVEDDDNEEDASELKDVSEDEEASEENVDEDEQDVSKDVEQSVEDEDEDDDDEDTLASEEENVEQSEEKGSEEVEHSEQELSKEDEEEEADDKEDADDKEEAHDAEAKKEGEPEEEENQQNSKLVVKIGVGVALLVVAHVVLVKKWKSASPSSETPAKDASLPDLSRRNTIVVPPTFQEVECDIEDNEEEYSDEDGEVESDEERVEKSAKAKYQELRSTYTRSLTPESEPECHKPAEVDDEEYEDEEEEEVEDEEEEDEESETGEYEKDDDDDELLKRLEARYGKVPGGHKEEDLEFSSWKRVNVRDDNEPEESDSDKQSDDEYEYENITNKDDFKIKEKIDEAHKNIQNNPAYAIKLFDVLLQKYSSSPRSLYGKANALNVLADQKRSNALLQKAIAIYLQLLDLENVPDALFEAAAERCINQMRFLGNYNRAIDIHYKLIARFPEETKYQNQLVVSYLTINRVNKARVLLQDILSKSPNDGFALVHYGFILKIVDNKLNESISYLQRGISTKAPGVIDGRFYFHLGDALVRLGKTEEAMKVYEDGVEHNLFLSKYQRSLYNVERLKGQPWWKKEETSYANLYKTLESNWKTIREEGVSVLNKNGQFQGESENLKDTGDWKQFELFARGQKNVNNCKKCPVTCKIIESIPDAKGCRRGQTKFSVMHPGTHVWPHCGPTNCRLRVHLGLKVPPKTYIRVADEIRSWKEGEVFIFDDSFEHEVWHNGSSFRLVLIVDVWHPELTSVEKRTLSPI